MIQLHSVGKSVGGRQALQDVSLTLSGGCVALVGANGSGKTTLIRLLATLMRPDAGQIMYHGRTYDRQIRELRRSIGYVPQHAELPVRMSPRLLLRHLAHIRRVADPMRPEALLSSLRLTAAADRPLGTLSDGQIRLVCIAQALLSRPDIVLIDNGFSGLGIEERQAAMHLFTVGSPARLTVFSTNTLDDVELMATELVVLQQGRTLYTGPTEALAAAGSLEHAYARLVAGDAAPSNDGP